MGFLDRFAGKQAGAQQAAEPERDVFGRVKGARPEYMDWKIGEHVAKFTTTDDKGRRNTDFLAPGYDEGVTAISKEAVPPNVLLGDSAELWMTSAADRERRLASDTGFLTEMHGVREYKGAVLDGKSMIGDTGRHVTLSMGGEKSTIMMELEPDGDVHRFLDLEAPAGPPVLLELPKGSYHINAAWGSSPMTDYSARKAKAYLAGHGSFESYTPPELREGLDALRAGVPLQLGGVQADYPYELPSFPQEPKVPENSRYEKGIFVQQDDGYDVDEPMVDVAPGSPPDEPPHDPSPERLEEDWHKDREFETFGSVAPDVGHDAGYDDGYAAPEFWGQDTVFNKVADAEAKDDFKQDAFKRPDPIEPSITPDSGKNIDYDGSTEPRGGRTMSGSDLGGTSPGVGSMKPDWFAPSWEPVEPSLAPDAGKDIGYDGSLEPTAGGRMLGQAGLITSRDTGMLGPEPFMRPNPIDPGQTPDAKKAIDYDNGSTERHGRGLTRQAPAATTFDTGTVGPVSPPPHPQTRVIDGRLHKDYGSGLYTRVAISMDEAKTMPQGDINTPSRYSVDDATERAYAVVDDAEKYMTVLAGKGAMAATARPADNPDAGVRNFAQVDRDVAFVVDGPDGKREVQNINAGGWMDYTDPKHPSGLSDDAFKTGYALEEAHRLDPAEFQGPAKDDKQETDDKSKETGSPADGLG